MHCTVDTKHSTLLTELQYLQEQLKGVVGVEYGQGAYWVGITSFQIGTEVNFPWAQKNWQHYYIVLN